jgi:hypothetical protein
VVPVQQPLPLLRDRQVVLSGHYGLAVNKGCVWHPFDWSACRCSFLT